MTGVPLKVMFDQWPDVEFPQWLRERGFADHSYRNDASAQAAYHFGKADEPQPRLSVWCSAENPEDRDSDVDHRYVVTLSRNEYGNPDEDELLLVSDDADKVIALVDQIKARLEGKAEAEMWAETKSIQKEHKQ
jgi:hypothetical protein